MSSVEQRARGAVDFEAWLDRDWPLWRNNPDNPIIARLRRAWDAGLTAAQQPAQAAPGDDEFAWREGWALAYSGADHLYGDDGELQDNRWPTIDWRRDSALEIRRKIEERGNRALAAAQAAAPTPPGDDAAGVECERCHGSGTITASAGSGPDQYDVDAECPTCGGTGAFQ